MKKILKASDFKEYLNKMDSLVASEIGNQVVEEFLRKIITDPTKGASGDYAKGYRDAISQILKELE